MLLKVKFATSHCWLSYVDRICHSDLHGNHIYELCSVCEISAQVYNLVDEHVFFPEHATMDCNALRQSVIILWVWIQNRELSIPNNSALVDGAYLLIVYVTDCRSNIWLFNVYATTYKRCCFWAICVHFCVRIAFVQLGQEKRNYCRSISSLPELQNREVNLTVGCWSNQVGYRRPAGQ